MEADAPSARDPVESLVFQALEAGEAERPGVVAGLAAAHPALAGALRRCLARLAELAALAGPEEGGPPRSFGPFELLHRLGAGGMGVVYLARNRDLSRLVALKLIRRDLAFHDAARRRFRREMQAAARLDHPNICPVYSAGEVDGVPYLEMPFLHGRTLADRIREAGEGSGGPGGEGAGILHPGGPGSRRELAAAALLVEKLARALHVAHGQGLVHRDVKPANVMITDEGEPVLMDFGLARLEEAGEESLTRTGDAPGTPAYMAPEQLESGRPVDHRADVYALGVTLYECLTLHPPFAAPDRESLFRQIRHTPPPDPRGRNRAVTRELRAIVETALEKDPARRYATALELAEDLRRYRELEPIRARRAGLLLRGRRWVQRNPLPSAVGAVLLIALGVTLLLLARVSALGEARRVQALVGAALREQGLHPTLSLLLALEATDRERSPETLGQLQASMDAARERAILAGGGDQIWGVRFARGGREAVTWGMDGNIRTWDLAGRETARIDAGEPLFTLCLSPAEDRIVAGGTRGGVFLMNRDGSGRREIARFGDRVLAVAFAADGSRFAAAGKDGRALVCDGEGRALREVGQAGGPALRAIAFHPRRPSLVLTAGTDGTARLWDLESPAGPALLAGRPPLLEQRPAPLCGALFSPEGDRVLAFGEDGLVRLWRLPPGEPRLLTGHQGSAGFAAWSPRGDRFLTVGLDHTGLLRDGEGNLLTVLTGHSGQIFKCAFSPDGSVMATAADDMTIRLWDGRGRQIAVLRGHDHQVNAWVEFSPDGKLLASASGDGTARLWAVADPELPVLTGHGAEILQARQIPGRAEILTVSRDAWLQVWDLAGRELRSWDSGHDALINDLAFSPDGRSLLTCGRDDRVRLWDLESGGVAVSPKLEDWVMSAVFDGAGERILTCTYAFFTADGACKIQLWDRTFRKLADVNVDSFVPPRLAIRALFLPGDREIAVACEDGAIRFVDLQGRPSRAPFAGHEAGLFSLVPDPAGRRLLSTAYDKTARIWDLASGRELARLEGHGLVVNYGAWSPDGSQVATSSRDGTARLWDAATGRQVSLLPLHRGGVWDASFLADGRRILTASMDGTARLWHRHPEDLIAHARRLAGRGFLPEERERYAGLLGGR